MLKAYARQTKTHVHVRRRKHLALFLSLFLQHPHDNVSLQLLHIYLKNSYCCSLGGLACSLRGHAARSCCRSQLLPRSDKGGKCRSFCASSFSPSAPSLPPSFPASFPNALSEYQDRLLPTHSTPGRPTDRPTDQRLGRSFGFGQTPLPATEERATATATAMGLHASCKTYAEKQCSQPAS